MGRLGRRAWHTRKTPPLLLLVASVVFAVVVFVPANDLASGLTDRVATAADPGFRSSGAASENGQSFGGVPAVGALFRPGSSGDLGPHFCTASVVNSPGGDLAVTAAHCVTENPGTLVFAPGYSSGQSPYGIWRVTRVYTDAAWQSAQNPDDDVAFLRLAKASDGVPIEDVTGAETLGISWPARTYVRVIGYPDGETQPVWCDNWAQSFSSTQLQFDCGGYTDGTSGGPFLAESSSGGNELDSTFSSGSSASDSYVSDNAGTAGEGTVIGVIGGYEQGGDSPSVSYSVAFGPTVASLFRTAEAGG